MAVAKTATADERWDAKPGTTVRVHQTISEKNTKGEDRARTQVFEGVVLAHRHGREPGATLSVRKVSEGIGVEKTFPLHSPLVTKVEVLKRAKVRRAKLGYLRQSSKRLREVR